VDGGLQDGRYLSTAFDKHETLSQHLTKIRTVRLVHMHLTAGGGPYPLHGAAAGGARGQRNDTGLQD
jgi:hypothetical protein